MSSSSEVTASALPVEVRSLIDSDIPFIFNSWLKAYRNTPHVMKVNQNIYFSEQHKLIERLLTEAKTIVISAAGDPGTVYGYVNYQEVQGVFVLHFAYVKHDFRTLGLFRELMKATKHDFNGAGMYTHQMRPNGLLEEKWNLMFSPYILINY